MAEQAVGIHKPDPRTNRLACNRLEVATDEVSFQSSNAWDAVGAAAFGINVAWINRFGQRRERLLFQPAAELTDFEGLPGLLGIA